MYVASPSWVQERSTTIRTMRETAYRGRSTASIPFFRRETAADRIRFRMAGSAGRKRNAAAAAGTTRADAAGRPREETRKIAAGAPMANPRFPPTENRDIPVARRSEAMHAVALNPSGWNAAVPSPVNMTNATSHQKVGEWGTSATPIPVTAHPSGIRNGNGLRSVTYPKRGWITEEVRWAAISSVPVTAYERAKRSF